MTVIIIIITIIIIIIIILRLQGSWTMHPALYSEKQIIKIINKTRQYNLDNGKLSSSSSNNNNNNNNNNKVIPCEL